MPFFSTIIPVYNREHLVAQTLDSVLAQEFSDQEIIVVDDGSTDSTRDVLSRYGDRIRVLTQPNLGPAAARNLGISVATGEYLAMFDSDDLWFPWTLTTYREVIEKCDRPAFIVGKWTMFSDPADLANVKREPLRFDRFEHYLGSMMPGTWKPSAGWRWFGNSSMVIRAEIMKSVGGYSKTIVSADDADMALRLGISPGFVQITNPVMFAYRKHVGTMSENVEKYDRAMWHLIDAEKRGEHPGGELWQRARIHLITMFTRPGSLGWLWRDQPASGWKLFNATLPWNLRLMRVRYLIAFPTIAAKRWIARWFRKNANPQST